MKSEKEKRKEIRDAIKELGELLKKRNQKEDEIELVPKTYLNEDENLSEEEKKRNIVDKF